MQEKELKLMGRLDVAAFLNVSKQYVNQLVRDGKLKSQKTSAGMIFLEKDVLAYSKERMRKAKTDPRIQLRKSKEK